MNESNPPLEADQLNADQPDDNQLRTFGLMFGGIIVAIFGIAIPLLVGRMTPYWPWIIAAIMVSLALLLPRLLIHVYRPWLKFGTMAGWINTRIILFILFYGLITPIALVMRLFGSDPLKKRFDPNSDSYRITIEPQSNDHMEKPY